MSSPVDCSSCKVCHGRIEAASEKMVVSATALGVEHDHTPVPHAHANCALFACPGCVEKGRATYSILNLANHIYDYHCAECMEDVAMPVTTTRRDSSSTLSEIGSESCSESCHC